MFLTDEEPTLETLDFTIRIGSTPIFLYFDFTSLLFIWKRASSLGRVNPLYTKIQPLSQIHWQIYFRLYERKASHPLARCRCSPPEISLEIFYVNAPRSVTESKFRTILDKVCLDQYFLDNTLLLVFRHLFLYSKNATYIYDKLMILCNYLNFKTPCMFVNQLTMVNSDFKIVLGSPSR